MDKKSPLILISRRSFLWTNQKWKCKEKHLLCLMICWLKKNAEEKKWCLNPSKTEISKSSNWNHKRLKEWKLNSTKNSSSMKTKNFTIKALRKNLKIMAKKLSSWTSVNKSTTICWNSHFTQKLSSESNCPITGFSSANFHQWKHSNHLLISSMRYIFILRKNLEYKKLDYYLYMTPPVQKLRGTLLRQTFFDLGCVPRAIFHFKCEEDIK